MELKNIFITIIVSILILSFGTIVIMNLNSDDNRPEYIKAIAVYVNEEGTDANHIRGALYNNNGYMLASTPEYEIVENSWNVLYFQYPVKVDTKDQSYILAVQGDGDISIPASGADYIVEDATYGTFPATLNDTTSTDTLSIYAVYR